MGKPTVIRKMLRRARHQLRNIRKRLVFYSEFRKFKASSGGFNRLMPVRWRDRLPCLNDSTKTTGFDRHYIYHTAWAARLLKKISPKFHVDISSSLYFVGIVSTFIPIRFYDYRPAAIKLTDLTCDHADLHSLPFEDESIDSLSCMHVLEHIGLGRYGDSLDPEGDCKAMRELSRVISSGGNLLVVVPVGKPRVQFNGQRVYSYAQIVQQFDKFKLMEFSLIEQQGQNGLITGATESDVATQTNGCGCFWLQKK